MPHRRAHRITRGSDLGGAELRRLDRSFSKSKTLETLEISGMFVINILCQYYYVVVLFNIPFWLLQLSLSIPALALRLLQEIRHEVRGHNVIKFHKRAARCFYLCRLDTCIYERVSQSGIFQPLLGEVQRPKGWNILIWKQSSCSFRLWAAIFEKVKGLSIFSRTKLWLSCWQTSVVFWRRLKRGEWLANTHPAVNRLAEGCRRLLAC